MSAADPFFQGALVPFSEPWGVYKNPPTEIFAGISASGEQGIYEAQIQLGAVLGVFEFTLDSYSIPDRFQIIFNSAIVADSLFVGSELLSTGTFTLSKFLLNSSSVFVANGFETISISALEYASDTLTRANGSNGLQIGVVANYPDASSLARDGKVKLRFNKTTSSPIVATLRVIASNSSTAWELTSIQLI